VFSVLFCQNSDTLLGLAHEVRLFLPLLFIGVTLTGSARYDHQLSVALLIAFFPASHLSLAESDDLSRLGPGNLFGHRSED
jgi:hypothetical protein